MRPPQKILIIPVSIESEQSNFRARQIGDGPVWGECTRWPAGRANDSSV